MNDSVFWFASYSKLADTLIQKKNMFPVAVWDMLLMVVWHKDSVSVVHLSCLKTANSEFVGDENDYSICDV